MEEKEEKEEYFLGKIPEVIQSMIEYDCSHALLKAITGKDYNDVTETEE